MAKKVAIENICSLMF